MRQFRAAHQGDETCGGFGLDGRELLWRKLADQLKGYVRTYLRREGPYTPGLTAAKIPADAATTSASGVDPDISEANALIQANRVAKQRSLPLSRVIGLVDDATTQPLFGLGGPKSVNVVKLNDALEAL